jgi:hypothetical protein
MENQINKLQEKRQKRLEEERYLENELGDKNNLINRGERKKQKLKQRINEMRV